MRELGIRVEEPDFTGVGASVTVGDVRYTVSVVLERAELRLTASPPEDLWFSREGPDR